jgi:hypothetical protein
LQQDAVDLLQVDDLGAIADGLEEGADAEVSGGTENTLAGADDQAERVVGEYRVGERDLVELVKDEALDVVGGEFLQRIWKASQRMRRVEW